MCFSALPAQAAWLNASGKISAITTYTGKDHILITLDSPVSGPSCNSDSVFAIAPEVPEDRKHLLLSVLLTAQSTGRPVDIAYDDTDCIPWSSGTSMYFKAYRFTLSE
jgi:hypothetical protein